MSDDGPFLYGSARVSINGRDIDATDVKVDAVPAIFDTSPSGVQRQMSSLLAPKTVTVSFSVDSRAVTRQFKGLDAKLHDMEKPLRIPSAQEIVMRQELGEFNP